MQGNPTSITPMASAGSSAFLLLPPSLQRSPSYSNSFIKAPHLGDDLCYVGSSHGWVIVLDAKAKPLLLHPSSGSCIKLPSFPANLKPSVNNTYFIQFVRKSFVRKAILPYPPSVNDYFVVIIYGTEQKIAFCDSKGKKWTPRSEFSHVYCDIIFSGCNKLYALTDQGTIEGCDLLKSLGIQPACEVEEEEEINFPRDKFSTQRYLVESTRTELLMVIRYIGNFVNSDGEAIYEEDLMMSEDSHPLVCPYMTKFFSVYKLDLGAAADSQWQRMKSLDDQILFLGANQSTILSAEGFPEFEANSIYFTDDRWEEMDLDYLYGGHDLGVFNVADGSIKPLIKGEIGKLDPAPIWLCVKPRRSMDSLSLF